VKSLLVAALGAVSLAVPAAANTGNPTVFADCLGKPQVKPADLVIACGDGNEAVEGITWIGWGSMFTAGRGIATINDCTPNCAAGHAHSYPVVVILTGRETCKPGGQIAYARLTLAFTASGPRQTAGSLAFPCRPS
jgi:hypothetical protein